MNCTGSNSHFLVEFTVPSSMCNGMLENFNAQHSFFSFSSLFFYLLSKMRRLSISTEFACQRMRYDQVLIIEAYLFCDESSSGSIL